MCHKHISQKQRNGRQFWKETIMMQFFILSFITGILYLSSQPPVSTDFYNKFALPPLTEDGDMGVFNLTSEINFGLATVVSKRLYFAPNNHTGIHYLIGNLTTKFPDIEAIGAKDYEGILNLYQENLFDTWSALIFDLDSEQWSSDLLVSNNGQTSTISYTIMVNPTNWGSPYPMWNFSSLVYNKISSETDLFWNTGYLTLQNYIATYLAQTADDLDANTNLASNFTVSLFLCMFIY
jgi:hypothetical protein